MLHDMSLHLIFAEFLNEMPGQSEASRYNYTRRLEPFLAVNGDKSPVQITRTDVNNFVALLNTRGYAEATMSGYRQALKAFMNYCVRRGYIPRSPADHIKTGQFISKRRKLPSEADVAIITALADQWLHSDQPRRVRDAVIWFMCELSGPRQREIGELRKSEVEYALRQGPDAHGIYKCLSTGKTKEILIRFNEKVADGLRMWLKLRPQTTLDRCFITTRKTKTKKDPVPRFRQLSRSATTHLLEDLAQQAGVSKPVFSHALRHRRGTKTTREHDAKLAAMILNHRDWQSAKTAMEFYYHPNEDSVSAVLAGEHNSYKKQSPDHQAWSRFFGIEND